LDCEIGDQRTVTIDTVLESLTLREERRQTVFENRGFRRIFGPRRDEVTWEWRKLHNERWGSRNA